MRVVVGKAYNHKTPTFAAELKYVIFQPYWDVPYSIQRNEVVPALMKNPAHQGYRDFQVVTSKGVALLESPVTEATLAALRSGKARLQQLPGPGNALGRVKFIFPNNNNVYLHDTPDKKLFSQSRRDFSHGCIRVEKPEELARWVLGEDLDWPEERITAALNDPKTTQVVVKNPIPVLIVYATAIVLQGGEVRFFDDIYQQDAALEAALSRAHP
jgi:murein L,D-transpeptidase YcbB/YkuD